MLTFASPILLTIALALVVLTLAIALLRWVRVRAPARIAIAMGLLLLGLSAGSPNVHLSREPRVAVMVDVSASTRTTQFHDPANLSKRLAQLLPDSTYRIYVFADQSLQAQVEQRSEIVSERTVFAPPAADAVVLFSDGRFELPPTAPPTFAVIDPSLEDAPDARIQRMEICGNGLALSVANAGTPRELTVADSDRKTLIEHGSQLVTFPSDALESPIEARLSAGDPWPENDAMAIYRPPPVELARWWVGGSPPSGDWRAIAGGDLPGDAAAYLNTAVIVLDNVPADSLTVVQHQRLLQYVRDLGGGLVILGGDRAFAAGGYTGTALQTFSPLSSTPPIPATHWVLLADASGSMAAPADGSTRWQLASDALAKVLPGIPPEDPVSIGSFARELRWWSQGRSARQTAEMRFPPPDVVPHGPTNLQPALQSIVAAAGADMPVEILIISDADTKLDVNALRESIRSKRTRLHLLATADIPPDNPVRQLAEASGGTILARPDPRQWARAVRELLRAASPTNLSDDQIEIRFTGALESLGTARVQRWNQVWPKQRITPLGSAEAPGETRVLAAEWNFGAGRVAAAGFPPGHPQAEALADLVASRPRDPRLKVNVDCARELRVSIDAIDGTEYLNDLKFTLELRDAADPSRVVQSRALQQTGPGRYELSTPPPRHPTVLFVRLEDQTIHRQAVAGRYALEFDAIGNDPLALRELASRTGGRVIEPNDTRSIDLVWPKRRVSLVAPLAATGAALIGLGLISWRLR